MAQKTSKSKEAYYASYKSGNKHAKNRKEKLERLLKKQPNNEQIKQALKDIKYRRKTPNSPFWSHSMIRTAKILKEFTGNFDPNIFNSNPKIASEALSSLRSRNCKNAKHTPDRYMFSIGARVGWTF